MCAHINDHKIPTSSLFAALLTCWDYLVRSPKRITLSKSTGGHHRLLGGSKDSRHTHFISLCEQCEHPYRASSCSGTPTQTPEEPWRSPPPSSPPARTTACHWQQWTVEIKGWRLDSQRSGAQREVQINNLSFTHAEAEVQQEKHVECHVNLQREVFVEVLTGLNRTIRNRNKVC